MLIEIPCMFFSQTETTQQEGKYGLLPMWKIVAPMTKIFCNTSLLLAVIAATENHNTAYESWQQPKVTPYCFDAVARNWQLWFLEIHPVVLATFKIFIRHKQDKGIQYLFPSEVATINWVISKQSRIQQLILYVDISSQVKWTIFTHLTGTYR